MSNENNSINPLNIIELPCLTIILNRLKSLCALIKSYKPLTSLINSSLLKNSQVKFSSVGIILLLA